MRSTNRAFANDGGPTPGSVRTPADASGGGPARAGTSRKTQRSVQSQRQMAETLVRSLGYDAAVEACFEHGWYGVLSVILAEDKSCG